MYKVITAVATEPVTTANAKSHLQVTHADQDTLIAAYVSAAREFAEHYTGRAFAPQTLEMALDCFPSDDETILLDMPPVASITHIKYTDTAGTEQTLSSAYYSLNLYGDERKVALTYGNSWPLTQDIPNAVRIRYVTGYTTLPKSPYAGLLLLIGHLFENRQAVTALSANEVPLGALDLLNTVKIWSK